MTLEAEYEQKWEEVKDQYPPDPALNEAFQCSMNLMEMVRHLEQITMRKQESK